MSIFLFLVMGLAVGTLSGTLGIGGGILLVPALMWFAGVEDQRRAAGITLVVLTPPIALPAVLQYISQGLIRWEDLGWAAWIAVGFALGSYGGALVVPHIPITTLRLIFGMMLLFVAVRFLLASDTAVNAAFHGGVAMGSACLVFLGLRLLGRRSLPPPGLGEHIRQFAGRPTDPGDYSI